MWNSPVMLFEAVRKQLLFRFSASSFFRVSIVYAGKLVSMLLLLLLLLSLLAFVCILSIVCIHFDFGVCLSLKLSSLSCIFWEVCIVYDCMHACHVYLHFGLLLAIYVPWH